MVPFAVLLAGADAAEIERVAERAGKDLVAFASVRLLSCFTVGQLDRRVKALPLCVVIDTFGFPSGLCEPDNDVLISFHIACSRVCCWILSQGASIDENSAGARRWSDAWANFLSWGDARDASL